MRLSRHFRSQEFRSHDGRGVPLAMIPSIRRLCRVYLEPLRSEFGPVVISSGYRSDRHNERVGGAPASFHRWIIGRHAAAADVRCQRGTPAQWYEFLDRLEPGGLGLYASWVHVDTRAGRARW